MKTKQQLISDLKDGSFVAEKNGNKIDKKILKKGVKARNKIDSYFFKHGFFKKHNDKESYYYKKELLNFEITIILSFFTNNIHYFVNDYLNFDIHIKDKNNDFFFQYNKNQYSIDSNLISKIDNRFINKLRSSTSFFISMIEEDNMVFLIIDENKSLTGKIIIKNNQIFFIKNKEVLIVENFDNYVYFFEILDMNFLT